MNNSESLAGDRNVQDPQVVINSGSDPDVDDYVKGDKSVEAPVTPSPGTDSSGSDPDTDDTGKIDKGI
jgi:hypothetical protein